MKLLITAGPTREPIDRVRFISNRSSGKMGLAVAQAGVEAGHEVTLLLGPGVDAQDMASHCAVHRFETASDLLEQLRSQFPHHDVLIMAAAVSDYRPVRQVEGKISRQAGERLRLELESTPDITAALAGAKRTDQRIVAFALEEPDQLEERAAAKLKRKGADAIVANPLATMDGENVEAVWLTPRGDRAAPGTLTKKNFGHWLIGRIADDPGFKP
jgi:phosphopantothenoylcysteine decarboxylase/phosphopantothenate--cysteine ligase